MAAVEIADETLQKVMLAAHTNSPELAVSKALEEFTKAHGQSSLIEHLGTFDDLISLDELHKVREA